MLVEKEDTIELGLRVIVVLIVVAIVEEVNKVCCIVHTAESVVRKRGPAAMNLHRAVCRKKHGLYLGYVVGELHGVSEDEHPRLARVGDLGLLRIEGRVMNDHDLLSGRDSDLRHGCQSANTT